MTVKYLFKAPLFFCSLVFLLHAFPASLYGKNVVFPLTLDYNLLTTLVERSAFPGEKVMLIGSEGDCVQVRASDPAYSLSGNVLRFEMQLYVKFGTTVAGECIFPVEWEGYISLFQRPVFDSENFTLSFKTIDSKLYTIQHEPAIVAGVVWDFVKSSVYPYLDQISVDLAPPVTNFKSFLLPLFPQEAMQATRKMLDSLHGGDVFVREEGIQLELIADVETIYEPPAYTGRSLAPAELESMVELWETWDVFLVQLITAMAEQVLDDNDRQILVDVLLTARHDFTSALEDLTVEKDLVRTQFINAWQQLAPVFRKQLCLGPTDHILGYLAFFTAADALVVFDRIGPTMGVEISQQGLLRLAKMLDSKTESLDYVPEVDERLREFLQLPPLKEEVPLYNKLEEIDLGEDGGRRSSDVSFLDFFIKPAYGGNLPSFREILQWNVPKKDIQDYVLRVREVLGDAMRSLFSRERIPHSLQSQFQVMIPAMAWQESCFRQFVEKNNKLTYLLSYNQSSVGLMQVNERVWRGIYNRDRLRWDIHYNALAGCEIAYLYLRKYILRKAGENHTMDSTTLAQAVYALYNGGPGQYEKFFERNKSKKYFRTDLLFTEKLDWVMTDNWQRLFICLIGG